MTARPATPGGYKIPPYSVNDEKVLVGSMLERPEITDAVAAIVTDPDAFFRPEHGRLYRAILAARANGHAPDSATMLAALEAGGHLTTLGGLDGIRGMRDAAVDDDAALASARVIREKSLMRALIDVITEMLNDVYHAQDGFEAVLKRSKRQLTELGHASGVTKPRASRSKK
ncbi:MAG: hypothetical protein HKO59_12230 [Phycisphaerales bacterium]|nr:hypothetical protein [Phycisphaerae bacterium]NNF42643.1 hypothetical protein [Phycisphaerales bacterium]NNM26730.1 hypothetical protein [Phycisphaerales bacterium]